MLKANTEGYGRLPMRCGPSPGKPHLYCEQHYTTHCYKAINPSPWKGLIKNGRISIGWYLPCWPTLLVVSLESVIPIASQILDSKIRVWGMARKNYETKRSCGSSSSPLPSLAGNYHHWRCPELKTIRTFTYSMAMLNTRVLRGFGRRGWRNRHGHHHAVHWWGYLSGVSEESSCGLYEHGRTLSMRQKLYLSSCTRHIHCRDVQRFPDH